LRNVALRNLSTQLTESSHW